VNITDTIMLNDMKPEERELYTQTVKSLTNPDAEVEPRIRAATLAYHRLAAGQSRLKLHRGAAGDLPGLTSSGDSLAILVAEPTAENADATTGRMLDHAGDDELGAIVHTWWCPTKQEAAVSSGGMQQQ